VIQFFVPGHPAPKGSRTVGRRKDGSTFTRPANRNEKAWTEAVALVARAHGWLPAPYAVRLAFVMPRPKRPSYEWPVRGDCDKLERGTLDGLQLAGVISEDKHVIDLASSKRFGPDPGAHIWIETANPQEENTDGS
jgi:Holliday junction resolvase RusA-like endonuclease